MRRRLASGAGLDESSKKGEASKQSNNKASTVFGRRPSLPGTLSEEPEHSPVSSPSSTSKSLFRRSSNRTVTLSSSPSSSLTGFAYSVSSLHLSFLLVTFFDFFFFFFFFSRFAGSANGSPLSTPPRTPRKAEEASSDELSSPSGRGLSGMFISRRKHIHTRGTFSDLLPVISRSDVSRSTSMPSLPLLNGSQTIANASELFPPIWVAPSSVDESIELGDAGEVQALIVRLLKDEKVDDEKEQKILLVCTWACEKSDISLTFFFEKKKGHCCCSQQLHET